MYSPRDLLILNVGFIIHQTTGYSRDFPFEAPYLLLGPDLELHNFSGITRVTRTPQGLLMQSKMQGFVQAECVRCLTDFPQLLEAEFTDLYAFTRDSVTEAGLLVPDNGKINLEPIAREELLISVPISPLCRPDCKGLCPVCGGNLNEQTCSHEAEETNPRLDMLKSLLDLDKEE